MACRQRFGLPLTETPDEAQGKVWGAHNTRRSQAKHGLWKAAAGTAIGNFRKITSDKQKNQIAQPIA